MAVLLKKFYMDELVEQKKRSVRRAIRRDCPFPDLYLVTLATNDIDQLNIISAGYLIDRRIREHLPPVAGAAFGKTSAICLVQKMVEETWRATGTADVRAYLLQEEARCSRKRRLRFRRKEAGRDR